MTKGGVGALWYYEMDAMDRILFMRSCDLEARLAQPRISPTVKRYFEKHGIDWPKDMHVELRQSSSSFDTTVGICVFSSRTFVFDDETYKHLVMYPRLSWILPELPHSMSESDMNALVSQIVDFAIRTGCHYCLLYLAKHGKDAEHMKQRALDLFGTSEELFKSDIDQVLRQFHERMKGTTPMHPQETKTPK